MWLKGDSWGRISGWPKTNSEKCSNMGSGVTFEAIWGHLRLVCPSHFWVCTVRTEATAGPDSSYDWLRQGDFR